MPSLSRTTKNPSSTRSRVLDYLDFGRLLLACQGLPIGQVWDTGRERNTSHANIARFGHGSDPLGVGHCAGHVGAYVLDGTPGFISISNSWMEWSRSPMGSRCGWPLGHGVEVVRQDRASIEHQVIRLYRPTARARNPSPTGRIAIWPFRALHRSAGPRGGNVRPGA